MQIEFDPKKDAANRFKHGISLEAATVMDLASGTIIEDRRFDYGETRLLAYAPIEGRLYALYHTRRGDLVRPIGLTKANSRERRLYEKP